MIAGKEGQTKPENEELFAYAAATATVLARRRAETSMAESEERFRELFNRMSSGVAVYEAVDNGGDFIFRDFNPAAERIEKISRKDIIGKRVTEAFPGVEAFGIFEVFKRVWQTGKPEYYPENVYEDEKTSGSWRESWVFKLPTGEIVAIYNDITDRKRAEEKLNENSALLRIAGETAKLGGWSVNLQENRVTWSDQVAAIMKCLPDTHLWWKRE